MHDLPHTDDLLAIARDTLLNELLPHLPATQKYGALMVANAMAIASREYRGAAAAEQARRALQCLAPGCAEIVAHDTRARDQQLCQDLRNGALDADLAALLPALRADVSSRLQVGNPKYLRQIEALTAQPVTGGTACPS
jgi:hypothetical protein